MMERPVGPVVSETFDRLWNKLNVYQIALNPEGETRSYVLLLELANHFGLNLSLSYTVIRKFPEQFRSPRASFVRLDQVRGDNYEWIFRICRQIGTRRSVPAFIDVKSAKFFKDVAFPAYKAELVHKKEKMRAASARARRRNKHRTYVARTSMRQAIKASKATSSSSSSSSTSFSSSTSSTPDEPVVLLGQVDILDSPPSEEDENDASPSAPGGAPFPKKKKRKGRPSVEASRTAPKSSRATKGQQGRTSSVKSSFTFRGQEHFVTVSRTPLFRDFEKLQTTRLGDLLRMRYVDLMNQVKAMSPMLGKTHYEGTLANLVLLPPSVTKGPNGPTVELVPGPTNNKLLMTRMGHFLWTRYKDALCVLQHMGGKFKALSRSHNEHTRSLFHLMVQDHVKLIKDAEGTEQSP